MVISEEKKELLRKHFNEDNVIIEYGLNFLDLNTHYVNSIKELNAILDNSENYRYICCHELIPYNDIKDLLERLNLLSEYKENKTIPKLSSWGND